MNADSDNALQLPENADAGIPDDGIAPDVEDNNTH